MVDERYPYVVLDTPSPCPVAGQKVTGYLFTDRVQAGEFMKRAKYEDQHGVWMGQVRLTRVEGEDDAS